MSYDFMVFDASAAPHERKEFMRWFREQTQWKEKHDYLNHSVTTPGLKNWYFDLIKAFPPMNGPLASEEENNAKITGYSVGKHMIYASFSLSEYEEAYALVRRMAMKHALGLFDVSAKEGELFIPKTVPTKTPFWKFWAR